MWRELFTGNPATALAVLALFFFILVFAAAVIWASSRKRAAHYQRMATLPIETDDEVRQP